MGLLAATKIKKIPSSMIWPYLVFPFGGYLLGRIAEQYLQRRVIPPISTTPKEYSAYYYG
uniref:Uncharacterized protein n=1 Tax=Thermodesulfobacterium geofontis TaxID=1295609 RepID=A0A7V5XG85_9BACT